MEVGCCGDEVCQGKFLCNLGHPAQLRVTPTANRTCLAGISSCRRTMWPASSGDCCDWRRSAGSGIYFIVGDTLDPVDAEYVARADF